MPGITQILTALPIAAALALAVTGPCAAGMPFVSSVSVSDATPRSFSVTWVSSEPSVAGLNLFLGDCVTPATGHVVKAEGRDSTGVHKASVSRLLADTEYCFQTVTTSKSTSETKMHPPDPGLVRTARKANRLLASGGGLVPFGNALLKAPQAYSALLSPSEGVLVSLSVDGVGLWPVTIITGPPGTNYFNLNNIFSALSAESLNLTGGERLRIAEQHGLKGCSIERFRKVPQDLEATAAQQPSQCFSAHDIDCSETVNILDILRVVQGFGSSQGGVCFNADIDLDSNGNVDILDILSVVGRFGENAATP